MLYGGDAHIALDERGREPGIADILATRTDFHRLGKIHAPKDNPCIHRRRTQGHVNLVAGMETHACRPDYVFERALFDHYVWSGPWGRSAKTRRSVAQPFFQ